VTTSSRGIDRLQATFDHEGIVANAGLIVPATLMVRLGLESLIDTWVKTGSANPGRKVLTLVAAMIAGATHSDHVNMLRAGSTQRVLPFQGDGPLDGRVVPAFVHLRSPPPARRCAGPHAFSGVGGRGRPR